MHLLSNENGTRKNNRHSSNNQSVQNAYALMEGLVVVTCLCTIARARIFAGAFVVNRIMLMTTELCRQN